MNRNTELIKKKSGKNPETEILFLRRLRFKMMKKKSGKNPVIKPGTHFRIDIQKIYAWIYAFEINGKKIPNKTQKLTNNFELRHGIKIIFIQRSFSRAFGELVKVVGLFPLKFSIPGYPEV